MADLSLTRKEFLHLSLGAAAVTLTGCPSDDTGSDSTTGDGTTAGPTTAPTGSGTSPTSSPSTTDGTSTTDPETGSTTTGDTDTTGTPDTGSSSGSGSESGSGSSSSGAAADCTNNGAEIETDIHAHMLQGMAVIPPADIAAAVEVEYTIDGSGHMHTFTLTQEDFEMLQQGMQVVVNSSFDGHMHMVTVTCA